MEEKGGPALKVENLTFPVNGEAILKNLSFSLGRGEFVAIVGPNGAGKSTLLKCIDRIFPRYRGEIFLDSKSARRFSQKELARKMAYVPQLTDGFSGFTVQQFVEQGRYPWKKSFEMESAEDLRVVEEAMRLVRMEGLEGRFVDSLSGGERQRVLIAAALAQSSQLLLLDEPTTYLDYRHQVEMLELIRFVHQRKKLTILAVTHDLNFALQSADRLIVLSKGSIVWEGSAAALARPGLLERLFETDFLRFEGAMDREQAPLVVPAAFASRVTIREESRRP
ncbi:MAG: ABC transporter ATP-binding protein [Synergistaceae bacterium]|nr:ABC transporter ATP-binding protein [Synergistaceae bacterium]